MMKETLKPDKKYPIRFSMKNTRNKLAFELSLFKTLEYIPFLGLYSSIYIHHTNKVYSGFVRTRENYDLMNIFEVRIFIKEKIWRICSYPDYENVIDLSHDKKYLIDPNSE